MISWRSEHPGAARNTSEPRECRKPFNSNQLETTNSKRLQESLKTGSGPGVGASNPLSPTIQIDLRQLERSLGHPKGHPFDGLFCCVSRRLRGLHRFICGLLKGGFDSTRNCIHSFIPPGQQKELITLSCRLLPEKPLAGYSIVSGQRFFMRSPCGLERKPRADLHDAGA